MTEHLNAALKYSQDHRQENLGKMKEIIAIPSVSTDPERKEDIQNAAKWLEKELYDLGMTQCKTSGSNADAYAAHFGIWRHGLV